MMGHGETFSQYYISPSMRIQRDGRKTQVHRSAIAWDVAIEGHRRSAHGGQRSDTCTACCELEAKRAEAMEAQNLGR